MYLIRKCNYHFENEKFLRILLFPIENDNNNLNDFLGVNEMSIMTSSIAHELKNPIAGISATLDILELEIHSENELFEIVTEMRENIKRCSKLVSIFLGFSKTKTRGVEKVSIDEALNEALGLLKCRIVESNINTKFKFIGTHSTFLVHLPPMTMFFYVLIS